jgi:uncharacterized membrane protein
MSLFLLIIILCALAGIVLAGFIRYAKKVPEKPFVCPLDLDCRPVITSRFSKFLGIDLALMGIMYYSLILVIYGMAVLVPNTLPDSFLFGGLILSAIGFLFSLYLTFIQGIVLKQWCSWCLGSAFLTLIIFVISTSTTPLDISALLLQFKTPIVILHAFSAAVGVGAVVMTDVFFFRFLKDYRISHKESETLDTISQVVWFALGMLVLTGLGLFFGDTARYLASTKFLTKSLIVGILIVNGVLLNLLVAPRLIDISFGKAHVKQPGELHRLRKISYALGAVSLTSWVAAFILGSLQSINLSVGAIFGIYAVLVVIAIIGSQIFDSFVTQHKV